MPVETKERKKRTRHVFPTGEVAHIWARQTQREGRNAQGNFFFVADTIYSYGNHFPIARFVDEKVVLFTTRGYSSTTAGHISCVRGAIPPDVTVITVDNIRANNKEAYQHNLDELWKTVVGLAESHRRARKHDFTQEVRSAVMNLNNYANLVRLGRTKKLAQLREAINAPRLWVLVLGIPAEQAIEIDAKRVAYRETDERRNREKNERREARRQAEIALVQPAAEAAWRAGQHSFTVAEPDGIGSRHLSVSSCVYSLPTMLRLSADRTQVETSHGARVSVETAKRIWPVLKRRCKPGAEDVEGYQAIGWHSTDDALQIGCHRIPFSEMERIAVELGLEKREEVPSGTAN